MMNSMFVCASWDGKCSGDTVWTSLWCPQVYISIQRSTILLTATGIPLMLIHIFSKDILLLLDESSAIASAAAVFVYGLISQLFAYMLSINSQYKSSSKPRALCYQVPTFQQPPSVSTSYCAGY